MSVCKFRSGNSGSTYTFFAFCSSVQVSMACGRVTLSPTWPVAASVLAAGRPVRLSAMCAQDNASPLSFLLQAPLPSCAQKIVNGVHCSTMVHLQQGYIEKEIGAASR